MTTLFNALTRQPLFHWGGGISFFPPIVIPPVHKLRAAGRKNARQNGLCQKTSSNIQKRNNPVTPQEKKAKI